MAKAETRINPAQLQRISLDKNFFWDGILRLNENGGHSIFPFSLQPSSTSDLKRVFPALLV
jgi:hypothetical protein